jgi:hypothetical protein
MSDVLDRLKAALADRYTIERELGSGGMAIVYLARELTVCPRMGSSIRGPLSAVLVLPKSIGGSPGRGQGRSLSGFRVEPRFR